MHPREALTYLLVALLAAPPVFSAGPADDKAGCPPEILASGELSGTASSYAQEIKTLRSKIREALKAERESATSARVAVAEKWVAESLDHLRGELAYAEARLAAIQDCPSSGLFSWGGKQAGCAYWQTQKALDQVAKVVVPLVISYTSEMVGLSSPGMASVAAARGGVLDEIESARTALQEAEASGDFSEARRIQLRLTALAIQKWTVPYLAGAWSQMVAGLSAAKHWLTTPRTEDQKLAASAARVDLMSDMAANTYSALSAFTLREMRSNSYVFFDYAYRFVLVATANILVNFVKAFPGLPWPSSAPWHLIPNASVMMALQSEAAARTTVVQTGTLPPKDFEEVLLRMPRIIAGKTGWVNESFNRLTTFAAQIPLEWPVLTVFTSAYMASLGLIDPLSLSGWLTAGSASVAFLSGFGVYLTVKWAVWDKPMDLGIIPSLRSLAGGEYNRALVQLAKAHQIPVAIENVVDPRSGESSQIETVAWHGKMWRQWAECFVPEGQKAERFTYSAFAQYFASGKWRPRLAAFRKDYEKWRAFNKTAEVQALNASPAGKLRSRMAVAEFTYRATNTGIDTLTAILLAGSGLKASAKP